MNQKPQNKESRFSGIKLFCFILFSLFVFCGCMAPTTFVRTLEPNWASTEIAQDKTYDEAWESLIDITAKNFDIVMLDKDNGYFRTAWLYTWTGALNERYRVRITGKFDKRKGVVSIKSEAEYGGAGYWTQGYDTRLLGTIKTDYMGTVGRTTR